MAPSRILNPIALRKTKIAYNFGLSECSRVKAEYTYQISKELEENYKQCTDKIAVDWRRGIICWKKEPSSKKHIIARHPAKFKKQNGWKL